VAGKQALSFTDQKIHFSSFCPWHSLSSSPPRTFIICILTSFPDFINLGASSVTITGRTLARAQAAAETISKATGKPDVIHCLELDMSTIASTKRFAENLMKSETKMDVIYLNAGVYMTKYKKSEDGFEESIQVNVLGTTLLALLLLPWLQKVSTVGTPHMTIITSGVHREVPLATLPKKDILSFYSQPENFPKPKIDIYYITKLFLQYCVREVAELAKKTNSKVVVNPCCPGMSSFNLLPYSP
jgi:NAD(P)-dependent dehydrogenase (short-subunit alcohol dehydrogenase family)